MNLYKQLGALFSAIMKEAKANPQFAERLQHALGMVSEKNAAASRSNRRVPAILDPFEVYGKGAEALRDQLTGLGLEQLRDVVAQYGMDRSKLAMKWKDKDRLIDLILNAVATRITKGDAFRAPATLNNSTKGDSDLRTARRTSKVQAEPSAKRENTMREIKGRCSKSVAETLEAKRSVKAMVQGREAVVWAGAWETVTKAEGEPSYYVRAREIRSDVRDMEAEGTPQADATIQQLITKEVFWEAWP